MEGVMDRDIRTCRRCRLRIERIDGTWVVMDTGTTADGLSYCPPDPDAERHGQHLPAARKDVSRKLSATQQGVLSAMAGLTAADANRAAVWTAREIAVVTGQSSDGAAYTLRSLVARELVATGGHDGERYGYKLTPAGAEQANRERQ